MWVSEMCQRSLFCSWTAVTLKTDKDWTKLGVGIRRNPSENQFLRRKTNSYVGTRRIQFWAFAELEIKRKHNSMYRPAFWFFNGSRQGLFWNNCGWVCRQACARCSSRAILSAEFGFVCGGSRCPPPFFWQSLVRIVYMFPVLLRFVFSSQGFHVTGQGISKHKRRRCC